MASTRDWFETVAEARRRARRRLPRSVYLDAALRALAAGFADDILAEEPRGAARRHHPLPPP